MHPLGGWEGKEGKGTREALYRSVVKDFDSHYTFFSVLCFNAGMSPTHSVPFSLPLTSIMVKSYDIPSKKRLIALVWGQNI